MTKHDDDERYSSFRISEESVGSTEPLGIIEEKRLVKKKSVVQKELILVCFLFWSGFILWLPWCIAVYFIQSSHKLTKRLAIISLILAVLYASILGVLILLL
eukprot:TRINITY_DN5608_c0_g1_i1.p1 TRINITY_DN5608_c0_g1~~TRINITY_DN5608_c0_g1_i1.p1  ORF type:complete len:102 (-),score=5.26 TRINITY_DN5608_c0_g1_i1:152-457(-)